MAYTYKRGRCRHCSRTLGIIGRGLCQKCHRTPGVRERYASDSKFAKRPEPAAKSLPAEPTAAPPGTPEKVAVMEARVRRGEQPHHPRDARAA